MTDPIMDVNELVHARATLGYSRNNLAADLGLPPAVVTAWETGRDRVPRHVAKDLRWRAALIERQNLIDASGLPPCAWLDAFDARPLPAAKDARTKQLQEMNDHRESCPTCLALETFAEEQCPPLPPPPIPLWLHAVLWVGRRKKRLPVWAQPALSVALVFGGYSVFRTVLWLPEIVAQPRLALMALEGTTLSLSIGAGIGLLYGSVRYLWDQRKARRSPMTSP